MMLEKLRTATNELHEEIEKDNLANLIISHKINREEYKLLLYQNFVAYKVTEEEIAGQLKEFGGTKHKQIEKDLENLDVDTLHSSFFKTHFSCKSEAEAFGAAYVVEGSALGGMMISKELPNCPNLKDIQTHHFFSGDRRNIKDWRKFSKLIKSQQFTPSQENEAIDKARETFKFFGSVYSSITLPK